jgi:group I intron endonuclease
MICGIYMIQCKVNNKIRIGSSKDIKARWRNYKSELNRKIYSVKTLQDDWNNYDKENFEFKVIEECNEDILLEREMYYTLFYKSNEIEFGYNINKGNKHSEETKLKMSKSSKGKPKSEESKIKMSISKKGTKLSDKVKLKMSLKRKGSNNPRSKITMQQSKEIKEKLNKGVKVKDLMIEYNCSNKPIIEIQNNVHWTILNKER